MDVSNRAFFIYYLHFVSISQTNKMRLPTMPNAISHGTSQCKFLRTQGLDVAQLKNKPMPNTKPAISANGTIQKSRGVRSAGTAVDRIM
jgi:hypothetical protein